MEPNLFPTSDEDSSTPDLIITALWATGALRFRPLTRIHLLLTTFQKGTEHERDSVSDL